MINRFNKAKLLICLSADGILSKEKAPSDYKDVTFKKTMFP
jgi:hypothetical protein